MRVHINLAHQPGKSTRIGPTLSLDFVQAISSAGKKSFLNVNWYFATGSDIGCYCHYQYRKKHLVSLVASPPPPTWGSHQIMEEEKTPH